jgi:hypothetical protein
MARATRHGIIAADPYMRRVLITPAQPRLCHSRSSANAPLVARTVSVEELERQSDEHEEDRPSAEFDGESS